jgi:photosystem I P700 chlorophyll a apoprotein A2
MATKFPKFSQALAQDPATRRIWYGIATAHDLESHDGMTEESLYQKIFASHSGHLAIIFYGHQVIYFTLHGKVTFNNGF